MLCGICNVVHLYVQLMNIKANEALKISKSRSENDQSSWNESDKSMVYLYVQ